MVPLASIPVQALASAPQMKSNIFWVSFELRPDFGTQLSEETMQLHKSGLAIGGRLLDAAQSEADVGHARATVLVLVYAEEAVELGLILAS